MRILILNNDYPSFLRRLYAEDPALADAGYAEQMARRDATLNASSMFYAQGLAAHGHEARVVYANNPWLQSAWAREHGMAMAPDAQSAIAHRPALEVLKRKLHPLRGLLRPLAQRFGLSPGLDKSASEVLLAQVEDFAPDAIFNMDLSAIAPDLVHRMKKPGRVIATYCGIDPPAGIDLTPYDFGMSMLPWVVEFFRSRGLPAYVNHLAFEPRILDILGPAPVPDIAVSFVGSIGSDHAARLRLLERIAERFPFELWAPSIAGLAANSPLRACHKGEAFGREMYEVMRRSKITLNAHVGAARGRAANVRHFEATGVGSFLLTDNRSGLSDIFEPQSEMATYESPDDAVAKIEYFLAEEGRRAGMAAAAQQRTLRDHTYGQRTADWLALLAQHGR